MNRRMFLCVAGVLCLAPAAGRAAAPEDAKALLQQGQAACEKKNYNEAIARLTEAIRLDPKLAAAYSERGLINESVAKYAEAKRDYAEASRLDPKDAAALIALAKLQTSCPVVALRDTRAAVRNASKACELSGWMDAGYLNVLAAAYTEAGDVQEAIRCLKKAAALPQAADSNSRGVQVPCEAEPVQVQIQECEKTPAIVNPWDKHAHVPAGPPPPKDR
jgi:tetratricopeptide (TPR) repeat protein